MRLPKPLIYKGPLLAVSAAHCGSPVAPAWGGFGRLAALAVVPGRAQEQDYNNADMISLDFANMNGTVSLVLMSRRG